MARTRCTLVDVRDRHLGTQGILESSNVQPAIAVEASLGQGSLNQDVLIAITTRTKMPTGRECNLDVSLRDTIDHRL